MSLPKNRQRTRSIDRAPEFEIGDAEATKAAVLELVDSDKPPARLILGRLFPDIVKCDPQPHCRTTRRRAGC
ncbi:hypothetical protein [Streptomyces sp. NPDC127119]|uniref:hypothetical protein n=1 Tax=Streptomyces sp. NPDC127119 TaxID=3345370 RepID=UPI00363D86BB